MDFDRRISHENISKETGKWIIEFTYKNQRVRRVVGDSKRDIVSKQYERNP